MRDKIAQETVNQRINFLINHFEAGNKSAFGRRVDMKSGVIGDLVAGRLNKPSFDALLKIIAAYPTVSLNWLVLGEEPMLVTGAGADPQNISSYPPGQNNVHALGLLSDIPVVELGRVSFKARASFDYSQLQRFMSSDIFDTVLHRIPPGRTAEDYKDALVFDIEGDSMEPTLRDGQQVIAWPVAEAKWEHLHNTVCVVDYSDTVTVKAIFANDLFNTKGLTLHATGGAGGSFTVARKDIHSIWEVREFYGVVPVRLVA
jgi:hypothetical protein